MKHPILVADDDVSVRKASARLLRDAGFSVVEAEDGLVALEIIRTTALSAALLDWAMPGMTGDLVLAAIRDKFPDLPVVMISAALTPARIKSLKSAGATACFRKPADPDAILSVLRDALGG